jgi:hypothetical protein
VELEDGCCEENMSKRELSGLKDVPLMVDEGLYCPIWLDEALGEGYGAEAWLVWVVDRPMPA